MPARVRTVVSNHIAFHPAATSDSTHPSAATECASRTAAVAVTAATVAAAASPDEAAQQTAALVPDLERLVVSQWVLVQVSPREGFTVWCPTGRGG